MPVGRERELAAATAALRAAGCVAAEEEATELVELAAGDLERLRLLLERRCAGEPFAWLVGSVRFCSETVLVHPGVYVPRWQSEPLARRAVQCLPEDGVAIDLCAGSGAIAKVLATARPRARVVACELDERAAACATANGVEVYCGDLFAPLPDGLERRVDVVVGVVPYVPSPALALLPRDTLAFESPLSYDGGPEGTDVLRRVVLGSPRFLRPGGTLLLELGGDQAAVLEGDLACQGFVDVTVLLDEDDDARGVEAIF